MIPEITIKISMHPEGVTISKEERVVEEDFSVPPPPEVKETFGEDFSVPPPPEVEETFGDDFSVPPPPEEEGIAEEEKEDFYIPPLPEVEEEVVDTDVDGAPEVSSKK
jgi:hypothetical protein